MKSSTRKFRVALTGLILSVGLLAWVWGANSPFYYWLDGLIGGEGPGGDGDAMFMVAVAIFVVALIATIMFGLLDTFRARKR